MRLFRGEMKRMVSYRILPVSVATSLVWVGIFALLSREEARRFAPMLLYMDAGVMSLLLSGAFHHLERTDGTVKTMLVLPVSTGSVLLAKAMAAAMLGLISALVVCAALYSLHGLTLNYPLLILATLLAAMAHAGIGLALALGSRDFSATLGWVMLFMIVSLLPVVLLYAGVIPANVRWAVTLSPSGAATAALVHAAGTAQDPGMAALGIAWLAVLAAGLYRFPILRLFRRHACVE